MKVCEYVLNQMHVNKMKDEYFTDNMIFLYWKKLTEKFNYNSVIVNSKIWKNDRHSFRYIW